MIHIGEGKFVTIDTDIAYCIRMSLGIVFYLLHHFTDKFQINQAGRGIAVYSYCFFKVSQSFGVKGGFDNSFSSGNNRFFGPVGYGTGARGSDIGNAPMAGLPVLVIVYSTVTGRFHSICPKLCVSLLEEMRGWATAAKATVSRENINSKLRFHAILFILVHKCRTFR